MVVQELQIQGRKLLGPCSGNDNEHRLSFFNTLILQSIRSERGDLNSRPLSPLTDGPPTSPAGLGSSVPAHLDGVGIVNSEIARHKCDRDFLERSGLEVPSWRDRDRSYPLAPIV
jgi:hypothetical protein